MILNVYVPTVTSVWAGTLVPGSALVGLAEGSRITVYIEGWKHFVPDGVDPDDKWAVHRAGLFHAADRLVTKYPTTARAWVDGADVTKVGTWDTDTNDLTIDNMRLLTRWVETREDVTP